MNSEMEKAEQKKNIVRRLVISFVSLGSLAAVGFFVAHNHGMNGPSQAGSSLSSETSAQRQVGRLPETDLAEFNGKTYKFIRGEGNCPAGRVLFDGRGKNALFQVGRLNFTLINAGAVEEQASDDCRSISDTFSNTEQGPIERESVIESREKIDCKTFKTDTRIAVRISASKMVYDMSSSTTDGTKQIAAAREHCEYEAPHQ
jgi:hypothetical protein